MLLLTSRLTGLPERSIGLESKRKLLPVKAVVDGKILVEFRDGTVILIHGRFHLVLAVTSSGIFIRPRIWVLMQDFTCG